LSTSSDPIIETVGLSQSYGPVEVLHDVSVRVGPGATGLLGPNGSGKSTLLRTVLGLLPLRTGSARVLGLDSATQELEIRRRIGLVPESDCLIPGMNAVEMTTYAGQLVGMSRTDAIERAHEVLYYVGLGEARYRELEGYSQGMKQRLKLAQALVHDPDLLLLDEPTNGMDPPGREAMLQLIRDVIQMKDAGRSVIGSRVYLEHMLEFDEFQCYPTVNVRVLQNGDLVYPCRPIADQKDGRGGVAVNLLEVAEFQEAFDRSVERFGEPPLGCRSCFQQCFAEPSLLIARPDRAFGEFLRYLTHT